MDQGEYRMRIMKTINYKDLKKKDQVKTTQLGQPITGKLLESPKQGRGLKRAILILSCRLWYLSKNFPNSIFLFYLLIVAVLGLGA